jgi:hypothetical protein
MLGRLLWPLLTEGQDPDSREARVAYHLHRLKLIGDPLRDTAFVPDRYVSEISLGRAPLTEKDVAELALRLSVRPSELTRELTQDETNEWRFYRISARYPHEVWSRARESWRTANLTNTQAAQILGMDPGLLSKCFPPQPAQPKMLFTFSAAQRLAKKLMLEPEVFVAGLVPDSDRDER